MRDGEVEMKVWSPPGSHLSALKGDLLACDEGDDDDEDQDDDHDDDHDHTFVDEDDESPFICSERGPACLLAIMMMVMVMVTIIIMITLIMMKVILNLPDLMPVDQSLAKGRGLQGCTFFKASPTTLLQRILTVHKIFHFCQSLMDHSPF